jgi:hypothetical protein
MKLKHIRLKVFLDLWIQILSRRCTLAVSVVLRMATSCLFLMSIFRESNSWRDRARNFVFLGD